MKFHHNIVPFWRLLFAQPRLEKRGRGTENGEIIPKLALPDNLSTGIEISDVTN